MEAKNPVYQCGHYPLTSGRERSSPALRGHQVKIRYCLLTLLQCVVIEVVTHAFVRVLADSGHSNTAVHTSLHTQEAQPKSENGQEWLKMVVVDFLILDIIGMNRCSLISSQTKQYDSHTPFGRAEHMHQNRTRKETTSHLSELARKHDGERYRSRSGIYVPLIANDDHHLKPSTT